MKIMRADGKQAHTLDDARALLLTAAREFGQAAAASHDAARVERDAMRKLNEAQDAFDAAVQDIRADAPVGSNWDIPSITGHH